MIGNFILTLAAEQGLQRDVGDVQVSHCPFYRGEQTLDYYPRCRGSLLLGASKAISG